MRAIDAVRKAPVTVSPDATLAEAAELMDGHAVGAVLVVDDGHPVGIVTDRDLVIRALARAIPADARIDAVMSHDVVTIDAHADVRDTLRLFHSHAIRRLPVVQDGSVVGMISADDMLVNLAADLGEIVRPITGQVIFGGPEPREHLASR